MYILLIVIALIIFLYINYRVIFVSKYKISSSKIPDDFNGFKILHLSDWHCTYYGKNNCRLINLINKQKADIIVITGDFVIRQKIDYYPVIEFIKQINSIPVYFTLGNHEIAMKKDELNQFKEELKKIGVILLENTNESIVINNDKINIYGMTYNSRNKDSRKSLTEEFINKKLEVYEEKLGKIDTNYFNILLTHDPLNFEIYSRMNFDLIYAGHLHGGGIRIFGFGLATPRKNWFGTRLAAGLIKKNECKMIVSRGVGNSTLPIRIFNPPEISVTTLYCKKN